MSNVTVMVLGYSAGIVTAYISILIGLAIVVAMAKSDGEAKQ
jgi:hypothetical protein